VLATRLLTILLLLAWISATLATAAAASLPRVRLDPHADHFTLEGTGAGFRPWGVNYDRDDDGRLLEDYWDKEWPKLEHDFAGMRALGANTVRLHLQTGKFLRSPTEPNRAALKQLDRLLRLAERTGLYVDLTGLGCYERKAVPEWYNRLDETARWEAQARFWRAVARVGSGHPGVFCYDLMNEPIVSGGPDEKDWTPGEFGGKCFVQRLTLDPAGLSPQTVAKAWVEKMVAAVRREDRRALITVGVIPWALTWPGAKPVFYSPEAGAKLDFVSVHFYPKAGEVPKALTALSTYAVGKPIVIEEMFPLTCSIPELDQFVDGSRPLARGWIGFYWGKSAAEYRADPDARDHRLIADWLDYFARKGPAMRP